MNRNAQPPEGWFPFGTHMDKPEVVLQFSEETDESETPYWERPLGTITPEEHHGMMRCLCSECGYSRLYKGTSLHQISKNLRIHHGRTHEHVGKGKWVSTSNRLLWRRCAACGGVCHWHETDWVCEECGSEWNEDHDKKYRAPGDQQ